ncbi:cysteine-rich secretory protein family protein [Clostridium saccharobutylicum]|uniref:CAP domain-containing protein n=1 Tax=Clostridium saccharobutylicum TaxID=169679 RepID=UPI00098404BE|nr:CAP domain-containing protein [Clostridium saccharobutylicum]AQS11472.1 cysteine-rich secretory protein family protein [Clostridium saccharobutylicum]MBC2435125.1 SH3 domain-containing protein [Clostridium saccharobutylicum]NSB88602.1 putative YkwD family protein [Clostridium saccharobutylicum]NYC30544.1 putative YkwD family protein [Clostridium saccharobutylicum]OOM17504.1 cysteine-rich secretory protein family protein [Clostridium saccharobutylicum]
MKKNFFVLAAALFLTFTASCSSIQNTENQQHLIGGIESSVSEIGDIKKIKITADTSNVRSGCSNNASVVNTVDKGSTLDVINQVEDWFAVKLSNGQIGFVSKQEATPVVTDTKTTDITQENSSATPQPTQGNTTSSTIPKTPTAQTNSDTLTSQEQEMLDLINQARTQNNVPPLEIDMQVTNVARIKAQDMIDNNYFSHSSPKYGSPFDMLKSFGISYVKAGENIAGNHDVQDAHNSLMNSPGHRRNILDPNFTHIGIGIKNGSSYGNMFSQMFVSKPK